MTAANDSTRGQRSCPRCGLTRRYGSEARAERYWREHTCAPTRAEGPVGRTCDVCGYSKTYLTQAWADASFPRHSCERQRQLQALPVRTPSPAVTRECTHPGHPHQHGTRPAYVKDRCRCERCRAANNDAKLTRRKAIVYGKWSPYVDAAPTRRHLEQLVAMGLGRKSIARLSGCDFLTVRRILDGEAGRAPANRIKAATEAALLAVTASPDARPQRAVIPATGTRRRLQALQALGWTPAELRRRLGGLRPARLLTASAVTVATDTAVRDLYERLWDKRPLTNTDAKRTASEKARQMATSQGWLPPLAWDDIDTDPDPQPPATEAAHEARTPETEDAPDGEDLDEVAIGRAMNGEHVQLTTDERNEVIRRLTRQGLSLRDIAQRLNITARTVTRRRSADRAA